MWTRMQARPAERPPIRVVYVRRASHAVALKDKTPSGRAAADDSIGGSLPIKLNHFNGPFASEARRGHRLGPPFFAPPELLFPVALFSIGLAHQHHRCDCARRPRGAARPPNKHCVSATRARGRGGGRAAALRRLGLRRVKHNPLAIGSAGPAFVFSRTTRRPRARSRAQCIKSHNNNKLICCSAPLELHLWPLEFMASVARPSSSGAFVAAPAYLARGRPATCAL